jgi:hypothetical protein
MEDLEYPMPTDLTSCFSVLDQVMQSSDPEEAEWFRNSDEETIVSVTHSGFGMWIRNTWELWQKESVMYKYFNSKFGLWHADDMSAMIIKSYHRHINKKELNLTEQVDHHLKYWKDYEQENGPIQK